MGGGLWEAELTCHSGQGVWKGRRHWNIPLEQLEEQQETGRIPSCRIITPGITLKPKKGSLTRGVAPALEAKAVSRGSGIFPPL